MLAAMVEVCAERGVCNVSVAHVVARLGVSRRTFYEQFPDREACFLATVDDGLSRVSEHVASACDVPGRWRKKIRGCVIALLSFLEGDPDTGRILLVDTLSATAYETQERRQRALSILIRAVDQGRGEAKKDTPPPPPLTAEIVVGGVLAVLHARLIIPPTEEDDHGRVESLQSGLLLRLTGPIMSMIVLPYLGPAAARRELSIPVPKQLPPAPRAGGDPLRDLEMRLTYRTARVLLAVASHPGGSNRQVADASGITDQGQISKLLRRLHGLGLIESTTPSPERGAPNAWTLTEHGWRIQATIAKQTHHT